MKSRVNCYLDRIEGESAVLLIAGEETVLPAAILPGNAREGDHLTITIALDEDARNRTSSEISELRNDLKSREDGE